MTWERIELVKHLTGHRGNVEEFERLRGALRSSGAFLAFGKRGMGGVCLIIIIFSGELTAQW